MLASAVVITKTHPGAFVHSVLYSSTFQNNNTTTATITASHAEEKLNGNSTL